MRLCKTSKEAWMSFPFSCSYLERYQVDFPDFLFYFSKHHKELDFASTMVLMWYIWYNRDVIIHGDVGMGSKLVVWKCLDYCREVGLSQKMGPET